MAKHFAIEKYDFFNQSMTKLIHGVFVLLGLIPRRSAIRMAEIVGAVWFALDRKHRTVAMDNLDNAFGEEKSSFEKKRIARAAFSNLPLILFEMGWSLRLKRDDHVKFCRIHGLHHVRDLVRKGGGAIALTLHIGNWELLPIVFLSKGININLVYRPLDFTPMDIFFLNFRRRFGARPIPKKKSMRKLLSALRREECVGILLDQDSGLTAGVFADFFNRPACTNKGAALLALKTKVTVITTYLVRRDMGFDIFIEPEIPLIDTGRKEEDIQKNTARYNKVLEEIIRKHPEQWLWMHRRWKNKPPENKTIESW